MTTQSNPPIDSEKYDVARPEAFEVAFGIFAAQKAPSYELILKAHESIGQYEVDKDEVVASAYCACYLFYRKADDVREALEEDPSAFALAGLMLMLHGQSCVARQSLDTLKADVGVAEHLSDMLAKEAVEE